MSRSAFAGMLSAALLLASLSSCGGSASETPAPLEPTPENVHYDRSATTLPGELGGAEPDASATPSASAASSAEPSER